MAECSPARPAKQGVIVMNDVTKLNSLVPVGDDGFEAAAAEGAERILKGDLLKFSDGHWLVGREALPMKQDVRLVVMATAAAWVKWEGGKPVRYIVRQAGVPFPEREELGDLDESKWEPGPDDKPRDPWQSTRFVHLTNPETASLFTFTTTSWGGRGAVIDLADAIVRYRGARPGAHPVVVLQSAPMQTKFGKKWRPVFQIVDWVGGTDGVGSGGGDNNGGGGTATERVLDDEITY
jgi:hypothetical protein